MEVTKMKAHEIHEMLKKGDIGVRELTEVFLDRIEKIDDKIKAYITVNREKALEQADRVDAGIRKEENTDVLAGIPMALKDNICTKDINTTCSSKMLHNYKPPYNATVVEKLEEKGAVMLGKLNLDEFAMGSSTENSWFFTTRNPWDLERVPGGSSGGSAAAVAAGEAVYSLGSDTGGSIRQPAAFCGVVGLKPTYGRVSRNGLVAFASSLDQIGPITKDVKDCALVFQAITGFDPKDTTSVNTPVPDYEKILDDNIKGLRIGIPKEYFREGISSEVKDRIREAIDVLERLGAICEETSLPHTEYALPAYYIISTAEAGSNLARFDGVRYGYRNMDAEDLISMYSTTRSEGFGPEVKRRIILGTYALSSGNYDTYYLKALKVRTLIKQDFDRAWEEFDVLVTPTTPTTAFKMGEKTKDPVSMYVSDLLTVPANMAGIPAITVPCGLIDGLPVGMQIMAKPFAEDVLLKTAYAYECHRGFEITAPELEVN
ncbi:MAG: Asp-tRNA(Asn)/Glu-tRNA(Gln) amidotransferase subunit GatA [Clostridia bacterium]|nr:Asp-tRNA(Asn)/Glu-tRNA(Gln) amidotransferase subunit GatA [Clostridia bacterium]